MLNAWDNMLQTGKAKAIKKALSFKNIKKKLNKKSWKANSISTHEGFFIYGLLFQSTTAKQFHKCRKGRMPEVVSAFPSHILMRTKRKTSSFTQ